MYTISEYNEAAKCLSDKLVDFEPEVLIVLGSGLGDLAEICPDPIIIDYKDIPNMCSSTALGHKGRFVAGILGEKKGADDAGQAAFLRRLDCRTGCFPDTFS